MSDKPVRIPGADHPITVTRHKGRIVVRAGSAKMADTMRAYALKEASYPVVYYIPREDADMDALAPSTHSTYCPYKGDASYFSLRGEADGTNAVWSYEHPHEAVAAIRDHLAFYPDKVNIDVES